MSDFLVGTVADIARIEMGQSPPGASTNRQHRGVPLLNGPSEFGAANPTAVQWTDSGVRFAEEGDLLFCVRGSTTGRMNIADRRYVVGRGLAAIQGRECSADSRFVKYALDNSLPALLAGATGSVFPNLARVQIGSHAIPVPPIGERQAIVEVLGALDDKIAANTRLAETLDRLAAAEFEEARKRADDSALLSDLVTTQYGLTTSAHGLPGPRFLRVTDINKKPWIEWTTTPNCTVSESALAKYRVEPGDILVARMADPGKAAFVDDNRPEAVFASYLVRLRAHDSLSASYIYYFLRSAQYLRYADGATQGTVQRNMNAKVIVATEIPLPKNVDIVRFAELVAPLRMRIGAGLRENETLAATRDALLPALMSGKLRVRDAEKVLEGVL